METVQYKLVEAPHYKRILIFIDPIGKGRPRFWKGKAVTPKKTREYERKISEVLRECYKEPMTGSVIMNVNFYLKEPESWSKKKRELLLSHPCMKRPDLDNLMKSVLDAANDIAYDDDSNVTSISASKEWAYEGKLEIEFWG